MTKQKSFFGKDWTEGEIKFPKHLTPEIIHSALFIGNANNMESAGQRIEFCSKQLGDEAMSYAMALLILPSLMEMTQQTKEYQDFLKMRKKKTHQTKNPGPLQRRGVPAKSRYPNIIRPPPPFFCKRGPTTFGCIA